jgi:hypothetical protein
MLPCILVMRHVYIVVLCDCMILAHLEPNTPFVVFMHMLSPRQITPKNVTDRQSDLHTCEKNLSCMYSYTKHFHSTDETCVSILINAELLLIVLL